LASDFASNKWAPGVLRSQMIDFRSDVPFYDSRDRVIDRYRLTVDSSDTLQLVWVGQNQGSVWVKAAWAAVGLCLSASIIWLGWRLVRRFSPKRSSVQPSVTAPPVR
jgi:hypothetical protein